MSEDKLSKMLNGIHQSTVYEPLKISPIDIQKNIENPETKTKIADILFEPSAYVHVMRKYHTFMYVFTRHFNFMLKSQFRNLFKMDQTTAKNEFKKLKKWKIIGEEKYKGNHYIYPKHRAFLYAGQHFNWDRNLPKTIKQPSESSLLMDLMRAEYFVQSEGSILSDQEIFFPNKSNASYIPEEFENTDIPFSYHLDLFEWAIDDFYEKYKSFKVKKDEVEKILDLESPPITVEDVLKDAKYPSPSPTNRAETVLFHSRILNRNIYNTAPDGGWNLQLEGDNTFVKRFLRLDKFSRIDYYTAINNAALLTLLNKNCFVTKIETHKNKQTIHLAILHMPDIEYGSYSNVIGDIQRIACYQLKSTEIKITVLADTEEQKRNAFFTWKKAVEKRGEGHKVNLEARERKNLEKYRHTGKINKITKKDYKKFIARNYEFCTVENVKFESLDLDRYYADQKNIAHPVSIKEKIEIDKSFLVLFK